jgi:hypothetical protein
MTTSFSYVTVGLWLHFQVVCPLLFVIFLKVCREGQFHWLSARLPAITTPNMGSMVRNGVDCFIVPIQDTEALWRPNWNSWPAIRFS